MNITRQVILDYKVLISNPEVLYRLNNSLVTIPLTNLDIVKETITEMLSENDLTEEEKDITRELYFPLFDKIYSSNHLLSQINDKNKIQSDAICFDKENEIYINLSGSQPNDDILLSEENLEKISLLEYDVLNICLQTKQTLMTTNIELMEVIEDEKFDINVLVPISEET